MKANPFDEFDISPGASLEEITAAFRERAEDASEEEKRRLRAAWEALTLHPRGRLVSALLTFPERATLTRRPTVPGIRAGAPSEVMTPPPLPIPSLAHLVPRPARGPSSIPRPLDDPFFVEENPSTPKGHSR